MSLRTRNIISPSLYVIYSRDDGEARYREKIGGDIHALENFTTSPIFVISNAARTFFTAIFRR